MDSAGGGLSITEAAAEDVADFAEFFRVAWSESGPDAHGFTGASDRVIDELTAAEAFRRRVGGPDRRIFLVRDGDRVVGFSSTRRASEEEVELSGIIVLRSFEGLGIGTGLIESAVAVAQNDGYGVMIVKTETTNVRARSFHELSGFRVVGTATEHVDDAAVGVSVLSRPL